MADRIAPGHFKISDTDEPKPAGYEAWKRDKVVRALDETKDRTRMIPAAAVWKKLGLED